jgi:hypothetical protein
LYTCSKIFLCFTQCTNVVHHCLVQAHLPVMLMICSFCFTNWWHTSLRTALDKRETSGFTETPWAAPLSSYAVLLLSCWELWCRAGTGERHLKDIFKDVTRNSQQRAGRIWSFAKWGHVCMRS